MTVADLIDPTDVTVTALLLVAVVGWARGWVVTASSCDRRVAELVDLHDRRYADMRDARDQWRDAYLDMAAAAAEVRRQDALTGGSAADVLGRIVRLAESPGDGQ